MIGSTLLDRYRLDSELGRGGMGVVYRAHDAVLDRTVAVKVLSTRARDSETMARWRNEAQAAARLAHPGIVAVYDAGESNGSPFIVMELVKGVPLGEVGSLGLPQVVEIGRQLCAALAHAHEQGIVHRDLKPANVLVGGSGDTPAVKLADLGVARLEESTQLTQEGVLIGTASYLAPEQALGSTVDGRADLYSLGVVLYELSTGRLPFEGDEPLAIVSQHLHAPVVPPRTYREDVPEDLEALIVRCLAKDPGDRFATATEMNQALEAVTFDTPAEARAEAAPSSDPVALLDGLARGRMTGRREQMSQLRELWVRALKGRSHMALVSGEPGVGKTRLARELIVLARLQGAAVLQGGCYEFEATTPYLPWVEGLRQWVNEQEPERLQRILGTTAPELARLAPEIASKLGEQPASPALEPQQERLRLFDAFARFLQRVASEKGLLIFLDDLHWADNGTLQLLHYALRNLTDDRLMVLGCYREVELDRAHPLSAALVELNRERLATRVALGRLTSADTERMLAAMFGQERVSKDFVTAVHRETEGNPFFVEEVVKSLIENGQIYRAEGRWQRKDVAELTIPQSIKAAIGRRLNRLSKECVSVLHTAAALGKVFEFATLAAASSDDEDALLDALDEASAAQLVRAGTGEQFVFTHDKIREVLHEELNPIRQRRLHQRIGESLEVLFAKDIDAHVPDLAYHFSQGSDLEKGLTYSLAAAAQAERIYAQDEALQHFERARDCAEALERVDRLAEIETGMARVLEARGDVAGAAEHGERALALSRSDRERAALRATLGVIYVTVGDPKGQEHLHKALDELDPKEQRGEIAHATVALGRYAHLRGQHETALKYQHEAREIAETLDDPRLCMEIFSYIAGSYQHLARYHESNEWARRAIALGEKYDVPWGIAIGHEFLAENLWWLGRWQEGLEASEMDRTMGERAGAMDRVGWSHFTSSHHNRAIGQLDRAIDHARKSCALALRLSETRLQCLAGSALAQSLGERGRIDEAMQVAREVITLAESARHVYLRIDAQDTMGLLLASQGQWQEALAHARTAWSILQQTDSRGPRQLTFTLLAEALVECGELDEAAAILDGDASAVVEAGAESIVATSLRVRARLHEARGDIDAARKTIEESLEISERLQTMLTVGRTRVARARLREKAGDVEGARADLKHAEAIFETAGADLDLERARRVQPQ